MVLENDVVFGSVNANRRHYELAAEALAKADPAGWPALVNRRVPLDDWQDALRCRPGRRQAGHSTSPERRDGGPDGSRIEDYALIGDCQTAALVGKDGSIDWLCLPRFDSGACFAALLGDPRERPLADRAAGSGASDHAASYASDTLVLETEFETADGRGRASSTSCRSADDASDLVRIVEGVAGRVPMRMRARPPLRLRLDRAVGHAREDGGCAPSPGRTRSASARRSRSHGEDLTTVAEFTVTEGDGVPFVLTWYQPSHLPPQRRSTRKRRSRDTERAGRSGSAGAPTTASGATPWSGRSSRSRR